VRSSQALLSGVSDLGQDALPGVAIGAHAAKVEGGVYSRPWRTPSAS
jgi:hypothetical protein